MEKDRLLLIAAGPVPLAAKVQCMAVATYACSFVWQGVCGYTFANCFNWIVQTDSTKLVCANYMHWLVRDNQQTSWPVANFNTYLAHGCKEALGEGLVPRRSGDLSSGTFEAARLLKRFGDATDDLSRL